MASDKQTLVVLLRQEILNSRRGRSGAIFSPTLLCPKHDKGTSEESCLQCRLQEYISPEFRQQFMPCFDIPLDSTGRTLDLLTQKSSLPECEQAVRGWMEKTLEQLETELAAEEKSLAPGSERRRSRRFAQVEPVTVKWLAAVGYHVIAHAETVVVNAHGGLLRMRARLPLAPEVKLTRDRTGDSTRVRALRVGDSVGDDWKQVGFEIMRPRQSFWLKTDPSRSC